jgi:hypothetical protein
VIYARGVNLAPYGSVEDRVMREMVFRERQERVAHMDAIAKMIARVFNTDASKVFGGIVAEYASEVFQESYDADLLRRKIAARRAAVARVRAKRKHDESMIKRLEKMGEYYDLQDKKRQAQAEATKQAAAKAQQKPKPIK